MNITSLAHNDQLNMIRFISPVYSILLVKKIPPKELKILESYSIEKA